MPQISATLSPTGPMIDVLIGVSVPKQMALKAAGVTVPQPLPARLLIDTGASGTCVDEAIVQALGLSPTGYQPAHTPSTQGAPQMMPQYDISLVVPHNSLLWNFNGMPVMVSNFRAQGIDGLLGREVLQHGLFIFNGPDNGYVLAF